MEEMTRSELLKKYLSVTANLNSVKIPQKDVPPVRSDYPYGRGETVPGMTHNVPHYHSSFSRNSRVQSPSRNSRVQSPSGRVEGRASADSGKRYRRGERVDTYNNNNNNNSYNNNNNNNNNNSMGEDTYENSFKNSNINYCETSQYYNSGEGSAFNSAQKWLNEWNKKTKKEDKDKDKDRDRDKEKDKDKINIEKNDRYEEKYQGYDRKEKEKEKEIEKEKEEEKEKEKVGKVSSKIRGTRFRSSDFKNPDPRSPVMKSQNSDPRSDINNQTDYLRTQRVGKLITDLPAMCVGDLRRLMFVR